MSIKNQFNNLEYELELLVGVYYKAPPHVQLIIGILQYYHKREKQDHDIQRNTWKTN